MSRRNRKQRERERRHRREERRAAAGCKTHGASTGPGASAGRTDGFTQGVKAAVIDPALRWHIVRTLPRMGARALTELHEIAVDTYLPRASEIVVRRGRRVVRYTRSWSARCSSACATRPI